MALLFDSEQRRALQVLAYLLYRMGRLQSAERVFRVLLQGKDNKQAVAGLAAVALAQGDSATALRHVNTALEDSGASSQQAFLYLMRGQALWMQGRHEEAKNAVAQYLHYVGEPANL